MTNDSSCTWQNLVTREPNILRSLVSYVEIEWGPHTFSKSFIENNKKNLESMAFNL